MSARSCFLLSTLILAIASQAYSQVNSTSCPLNYTLLEQLEYVGNKVQSSTNTTFRCTSFVQGLHFILVDYVARSGFFLVPPVSAEACWDAFDQRLSSLGAPGIDVRSQCNLTTSSIAQGSDNCRNVTSVQNLTQVVPQDVLSSISQQCARASVEELSVCSACTTIVVQSTTSYLSGSSDGSINTCQDILSLYAASTAPNASRGNVAACLFNIAELGISTESNHAKYIYGGVGAAVTLLLVVGTVLFLYFRYHRRRAAKNRKDTQLSKEKMAKANSNLIWFTIDDIKAATNNFSRDNFVGSGGYGNVYKGTLPDGTEVAVKRFKNLSAAGDDEFFHEVEVISSVRHRNLVALKGCCVDKSDLAGHQRIIVYEYMPNGSLYDHLFVKKTKLDWPRRQTIALGIVRGLSYLHQEVQPAIIHRDIKASNILLDANWNARVADFGLAKFTPEGATHVTTRVAGTHGYVAPEYVLYGQLTEKSDVYSFGVVLLELLTGRKILVAASESGGPLLISDWAWSLVKQGRVMDVLDPEMDNLGSPDVLERFVLLALLCAHPQVPCRPTLNQVRKIMEEDQPLPAIPDRPIPYTLEVNEIEQAVGVSGLSSGSGFQSFSSHGSSVRIIETCK